MPLIMNSKRSFFDLFEPDKPVLKVQFDVNSIKEATEVEIKNKLEKNVDTKGLASLKKLCTDPKLEEFVDFYAKYNGFSLATPILPETARKRPLFVQLPVGQLKEFTSLYLPKGDRAWSIDYNKTKTIYRGEHKWLAFAEVDGGSACLTIFLEGEYAGNIFLVTPQPHFNTLKPIAKTYNDLLNRIAKDPAAFFKLTKAYVSIKGTDKQGFGYAPVQYINSGGILSPEKGEKMSLELIRRENGISEHDAAKNKWWKFW